MYDAHKRNPAIFPDPGPEPPGRPAGYKKGTKYKKIVFNH